MLRAFAEPAPIGGASAMSVSKIAVFVEPTPNPNSLKFICGRQLVSSGSYEFSTAAEAAGVPLAARLFEIAGVDGVFVGRDFVTVRKTADASWDDIEERAIALIEEIASAGEVVKGDAPGGAAEGATDAERVIRRILDDEIRPAVASDGGDVVFQKYDGGVLTLRLVGACSGCPSSTMTLKMGIERRLREEVPELREVVSVM